ncbi:Cytochrome P450 [Dillenia turbinata]|uniref:Cytochrome P450 n=1 Tax=Dillenia turbinata TaxID=194707 RepID=A0AAN8US88_9MAGN
MEATPSMWWLTWVLGGLPIATLLIWWWNEIWYVFGSKDRAKLPPGHMGFPFFGETLQLLWYFNVLRRPDDFINSKQRRYKSEVGLYKTHLFGSPSVIACAPDITKYVYQNEGIFMSQWPNMEIVGEHAIASQHGKAHKRLRGAITSAINVTFENIGNLFANIQPGPLLDTLDRLFVGLLNGLRAPPWYFPGTNCYHAIQCRKKLIEIFRVELEKRKQDKLKGVEARNDLMDRLMGIKDEEGNQLKDEEVLDNIVGLVVAGYQTTALSSMWAIYFLAKSPEVLKKLRDENQALSQQKNGGFITSDEISKLKYTNKLPKAINAQPLIESLTLVYLLGQQPMRPGTCQVFGGGVRICPGNMLARMQLAIFIHHVWELINPDAAIAYLSHPKLVDGAEVLFGKSQAARSGGAKLPPGHMGLPMIGETLTFLWYFKILRRPDDYINSKRRRYGDGVGFYKTNLFGRPAFIAWTPEMTFENIMKYFVSYEPEPLLDTIADYYEGMVHGFRALPLNIPGSAYRHALQRRRKLEGIFYEELGKRKRGEITSQDLMTGLMNTTVEEGKKLTNEEIVENIVSFIVAGYESTVIALMWAVSSPCQEEHIAASKNKKLGDFITYDEVTQLKYTSKVVEESIRIANIAMLIFRSSHKDVKYKDYMIPKGWKVILWLRYLHTDPNNFEDPLCFNPDRWDKPAKPGAYGVFGGGNRICAGNMLTRMQIAVFFHHMALGYKWELVNPNAKIYYLPHPKPADGAQIKISKI